MEVAYIVHSTNTFYEIFSYVGYITHCGSQSHGPLQNFDGNKLKEQVLVVGFTSTELQTEFRVRRPDFICLHTIVQLFTVIAEPA